jgi:phosphoserine phosphatase RsbU/P
MEINILQFGTEFTTAIAVKSLIRKLQENESEIELLGKPDLPIGMLADVTYQTQSFQISGNADLYLLSDGAYEIKVSDTNIWGWESFLELIVECDRCQIQRLDRVVDEIKQATDKYSFDDDLSMLKVKFLHDS